MLLAGPPAYPNQLKVYFNWLDVWKKSKIQYLLFFTIAIHLKSLIPAKQSKAQIIGINCQTDHTMKRGKT